MVDKIKHWYEREMRFVYARNENPEWAFTRCYGIFQFTINEIFDYDSPESQNLRNWWSKEMLPGFREAKERYYNK